MQERRARTSVYEFLHAHSENVRLNARANDVTWVEARHWHTLPSLISPHDRPRSGHVRYEGSGSAAHGLICTIRSKWIALRRPCPLLIGVARVIGAMRRLLFLGPLFDVTVAPSLLPEPLRFLELSSASRSGGPATLRDLPSSSTLGRQLSIDDAEHQC